jgi:hypothetical protein
MSISHGGHGCLHGGGIAGGIAGGGIAADQGLGGHDHGELRDHLGRHFGEGLGLPDNPMQLVFGTPTPNGVSRSFAWWQAVPLPGGLTVSLVVLVALACLAVVLASALVKTVVVACSRS